VDDVLLIAAMLGTFFFEVSIIMSSAGYIGRGRGGGGGGVGGGGIDLYGSYSNEILALTASLIAVVQTFLQVLSF